MEGKQEQARIASASTQNRTAVLEDLDAVVQRLRVADDLARELGVRLLVRHQELRLLRAELNEFRGEA